MKPTPLDKVLTLRPSNVDARLGHDCRLPVLNPRDLLASVGERSGLVCMPIYLLAAIDGVLRAAREQDAALGLALPHPLADREGARRFVDRVREISEEVRHRKPVFLQGGPFRVTSTSRRDVEQLASQVFKYVDAGFTLISLDVSALRYEDAAAVIGELAQPALERELGLEISIPLDPNGRADVEATRALCGALAIQGVHPQLVRIPGRAYQLEDAPSEPWQLDLSVLQAVGDIARAHGAAVSVGDGSVAPERLATTWLQAGVRKVDPQEAAAGVARSGLGPDAQAELTRVSAEEGVPERDLLAGFDPGSAADARGRLRLEALTYAIAMDLIPAFGARGSGTRAIRALAQGHRY